MLYNNSDILHLSMTDHIAYVCTKELSLMFYGAGALRPIFVWKGVGRGGVAGIIPYVVWEGCNEKGPSF